MSFNAHSVGRRDVYDVPASVSPTGRERPKTASAPVISNLQTRRPPTHLPAPDNTNDPSGDTMEPTRVRKRKRTGTAVLPWSRLREGADEPTNASAIESPQSRLPLAFDTSDEAWLPSETSRKKIGSMIEAFLPATRPGLLPEEVWDRLEKQNARTLRDDERKNLRVKVRLALSDMHTAKIVARKRDTTAKGGQSYRYILKAGLQTRSSPCPQNNVSGHQTSGSVEEFRRSTGQVDVGPDTSSLGMFRAGQNAGRDDMHNQAANEMPSAQVTDDSTIAVAQITRDDTDLDRHRNTGNLGISTDLAEHDTDAQLLDRDLETDAEALKLGRQLQRMYQMIDDDDKQAKQIEELQGQREQTQAALLSARTRADEIATVCASLDSEIEVLRENLVKLQSQVEERRQEKARLEQVKSDKRRADDEIGSHLAERVRQRLNTQQRISSVKRDLRLNME